MRFDTVRYVIVYWGNNASGSIGQGNLETSAYDTAVQVSPLIASELGVDGAHACALLEDKSMKCWGKDGLMFGIDYGPSPKTIAVGG